MVTNPNIGLRPIRPRGSALAGAVRLPAHAQLRSQRSRRRRRERLSLPQPATLDLGRRLRLGSFARVYILVGAVLAVVLLYLLQVATATQQSYEIGQLQRQQTDLLAEQDQLRYQEAALRSPSKVEQQAAQASLTRPVPYRYVDYRPVDLNLEAPPPAAPDSSPLWQRSLASLDRAFGGQDVLAKGQ